MITLYRYINYLSGIRGWAETQNDFIVLFKNSNILYFYRKNRYLVNYGILQRGLNTYINQSRPNFWTNSDTWTFASSRATTIQAGELNIKAINKIENPIINKEIRTKRIKDTWNSIKPLLITESDFMRQLIFISLTFEEFKLNLRTYYPAIFMQMQHLRLKDWTLWQTFL